MAEHPSLILPEVYGIPRHWTRDCLKPLVGDAGVDAYTYRRKNQSLARKPPGRTLSAIALQIP